METGSLRGRTCMLTGATSGIGKAAAAALALRGADLILVARDRARGEAVVEELMRASGNPEIELLLADLGELDEVRGLVERFLRSGRPLHVLVNNAGALDLDDLQSQRGYRAMKVYGKSKLMNLLFTQELARRLERTGVTVNALHPGFVASGLGSNNGWVGRAAMTLLRPFARTPEEGAQTAVFLCTAREGEAHSGGYWKDCRPHEPTAHARCETAALALWQRSAELCDLSA